ncbi:hypothetical protein CB1_001088001 [Camelus ferus]|nr:hypothetical protein CB1_001088001 [Camelus ferus]
MEGLPSSVELGLGLFFGKLSEVVVLLLPSGLSSWFSFQNLEGQTLACLPVISLLIVALKKKYKAYLYIDEAHRIGSVGTSSRGVMEFFGMDPRDVDVCVHGHIRQKLWSRRRLHSWKEDFPPLLKDLVDYLRVYLHSAAYATSMSPPTAEQIIRSMKFIMGLDGTTQAVIGAFRGFVLG